MRICLVSHEYPPESAHGGIGTQNWNKARSLAALGHEVHVLTCAAGRGADLRTETDAGVIVHRMRPPGEQRAEEIPINDPSVYMVGYTWLVLRRLHDLMQRTQFDLINFPEYGAEGFAYQLNRSVPNWVPIIVQLHAPLAMFAERIGWPERGSEFERVGSFMEGVSIRLADGLMASSANIADFTARHYGVSRESIDVVHCGVDCAVFRPQEQSERSDSRPTVLFVGNLAENKGIKTVVEAVLRLRSKYREIRLQILGKGDDLAEHLQERVRSEGAGANVEFVGFVTDRKQLAEYYRRAHVFASPASHECGVANVYAEAMACGCPVVAGCTGGAPEAVVHEQTGLLVPPRDVDATVAGLNRILGDESLRQRLSEGARRRALEYFAVEKYTARVLAAYIRAIERSREKLSRLDPEAPSRQDQREPDHPRLSRDA